MSKKATKSGLQRQRTTANVQRRRAIHLKKHPKDAEAHDKRIPVRVSPVNRHVKRNDKGEMVFITKRVTSSMDRAKRHLK